MNNFYKSKSGVSIMKNVFKITLCLLLLTGCKESDFHINGSAGTQSTQNPDNTPDPNGDSSLNPDNTSDASGNSHSFVIHGKQKLDILFTIDVSTSMEDYLKDLGNNFGSLGLNHLDWQVAFINAETYEGFQRYDEEEGKDYFSKVNGKDGYNGVFYNLEEATGHEKRENGNLVQILTSKIENYQSLFLNTISRIYNNNVPEVGGERKDYSSGYEFAFTNIINAIQNTNQSAFFRQNAVLAVVIIANEGDDFKTGDDVIDALNKKYPNKAIVAYGIVPETASPGGENPNYIKNIKDFAGDTGGDTANLDSDNYASVAQKIGTNLKTHLEIEQIEMEHTGIIGNPELSFEPATSAVGYTFDPDTNIVTLNEPVKDTTITVSYRYQ